MFRTGVRIRAYNNKGNEYIFESKTDAVIGLGVSYTTLNARLKDKYPIVAPNRPGIYVEVYP